MLVFTMEPLRLQDEFSNCFVGPVSALLFRIPSLLLLAAGFQRKRNPGRSRRQPEPRVSNIRAMPQLSSFSGLGEGYSTRLSGHTMKLALLGTIRALLSMKGRCHTLGRDHEECSVKKWVPQIPDI
eukprot:s650_g19.t1